MDNMYTSESDSVSQNLMDYFKKKKEEDERNAQSHTFNLGSFLPALLGLIAAPFTGGASLAASIVPTALSAGGEAIRASTGGDTNYGSAANNLYSLYNTVQPSYEYGSKGPGNYSNVSRAPAYSSPSEYDYGYGLGGGSTYKDYSRRAAYGGSGKWGQYGI
jgi:hypothetical protein